MLKSHFHLRAFPIIGVFLMFLGCVAVPEKDPVALEPIVLQLDSATATVPAPSDFLLSADPASYAHDADRAFFTYLRSIGGLTPTSQIAVPLHLPEGATLAEPAASSVVVIPLGADPVPNHTVAFSTELSSLIIGFDTPTPLGSRYAVAVLGNGAAGGLAGADGRTVTEPVGIFFSKSTTTLVEFATPETCAAPTPEGIVSIKNPVLFAQLGEIVERAKSGAELDEAEQTELAVALGSLCLLEGLRGLYEPVWGAAEAAGLARADVVMLFTVSTGSATFAELNSETRRIPTPSDLTLTLDLSTLEDSADKDFFTYLIKDLGGFPPTDAASFPFTGAIDDGSLSGNIHFAGSAAPKLAAAAFNTDTNVLGLTLEKSIEPGNTLVGVITKDIKDAAGDPIAPPAEFVFMTSRDPLVTIAAGAVCDGATITAADIQSVVLRGQFASGAASGADLCTLENARLAFEPAFDGLEVKGVDRDNIAMAFGATFPARTYATFDPAGGIIGFPNDFLLNQKTGLVNLPISPDASATIQALIGGLNTQDGFSTSAATYSRLKFGNIPPGAELKALTHWAAAEVNPDDTSDAALLDSGHLNVYYLDHDPDDDQDGHIWVEPKRPLGQNKIIIVALFDDILDTNGKALAPDGAFVFLRSAFPLVDADGKSIVAALDDATASALEVARSALVTVFDTFENPPFSLLLGNKKRADVVQVYVFHTQTVTTPLQSLRAAAYQILAAESIAANTLQSLGTPQLAADVPDFEANEAAFKGNVGCIVPDAELDTINFLNDAVGTGTFGVDSSGNPTYTTDTIGVTIVAPDVSTSGACDGQNTNLPVVIVQHGFGHSRSFVYDAANTFAEECYVLVAIDAPDHGGRDSDASSLHPDDTEIETLRADGKHGENFLSLNLFASRDTLRQTTLDHVQLVRAINGGAITAALNNATCGNITVDGSDISYVGHSLGGIVGSALLSVEPLIAQAVFSAAGGPFTTVIFDSAWDVLQATVQDIATLGGAAVGSGPFFELLHIVQWVLDPADPVNYATHLGGDPLMDLITNQPGPAKNIMLIKVTNDDTVPNTATDALIRALDWGDNAANDKSFDVNVEILADGLDHSVIVTGAHSSDPAKRQATTCAQIQARDWITNARTDPSNPALSTNNSAASCRAPAL